MTALPDLTVYSDAELRLLMTALVNEQQGRAQKQQAQSALDTLNAQTMQSKGVTDGGTWQQPTNALDSYRKGATVTYNGKTYVSNNDWNPYPPDTLNGGWVVKQGSTPTTSGTPKFDANATFKAGDQVVFSDGLTYKCLVSYGPNPTWTPATAPTVWQKV